MIIFKRSYNCERENRGWVIDMVEAFQDDKLLGYIKVSYISKENYKKYYASSLDYMTKVGGWCCESRGNEPIRSHITKNVVKDLSWYHWQDNTLLNQIDKMNDIELRILFKKLEHDVYKTYCRSIQKFKKHWVDSPIVDFIRVQDEYQRQGIGTQLYIQAGQMMQEMGLSLRASTCQSDSAKACWSSLAKQGKTITHGKYTYIASTIVKSANVG